MKKKKLEIPSWVFICLLLATTMLLSGYVYDLKFPTDTVDKLWGRIEFGGLHTMTMWLFATIIVSEIIWLITKFFKF